MSPRTHHRTIAILLAMAVVVASCAGSSDGTASPVSALPDGTDVVGEPAGPSADEPAAEGNATDVATTPDSVTDGDDSASAEPSGTDALYMSGDSDFLFDQAQLHTFEIDVAHDALAEIDADPTAEEYVEGSLTFNGETIGPIGVRYKGSIGSFLFCTDGPDLLSPSGSKTCTKLSLKLKINWDDPKAEFYGVRKVQLHSQNLDSSKMHERLGYWVFREMGVAAPRSTHARVNVNGEYLGVFALTEQIDGRFTRENFSDGTGNLYKEVWPFDADGSPRSEGDFLAGLETNEDENPSMDLIVSFADELAAADPSGAIDVIDKWTDIDTLLRVFVIDRAIKNDDGPLHWYCFDECDPHNFYWYESPDTQELTLIPWDLDNAFDNLAGGNPVTTIADAWGEITNDCEPFPFGSFNLPQRSAACDPLIGPLSSLDDEFDRIRAELLAGPMSTERIEEQLTMWTAQIEGSVADAAAAHDDALGVADWLASVDRLKASLIADRSMDGR